MRMIMFVIFVIDWFEWKIYHPSPHSMENSSN